MNSESASETLHHISLNERMEELALHCDQDDGTAFRRRRLRPGNKKDFDETTVFGSFACVVCDLNCVPRKELFETWAMAAYVQEHFPNAKRFCDMAAGHGLLAWALLVLGNGDRSAICVDIRMPNAADKVAAAMVARWPHLESKLDYVQGKLEGVVPSPDTLLVGVHCCHVLSDAIVYLAIRGNSPLALVPCCHAKKCLTKLLKDEFAAGKTGYTLAEFIDFHRMQKLKNAGFSIHVATIPETYTPKNQLIIARPPETPLVDTSHMNHFTLLQECFPELSKKSFSKSMKVLEIPVGDNPQDRSTAQSLAGREKAAIRERVETNLGLALFPPPEQLLTVSQLQPVLTYQDATVEIVLSKAGNESYVRPDTGKVTQTFRVRYPGLQKAQAKAFHIDLCRSIPDLFPGASMRQMPR